MANQPDHPIETQDDSFADYANPLKALAHGVRFLTNIEDTKHFFTMTGAIDGVQNERNYQRYINSPMGRALEAEQVCFADIFADRDSLRAYAQGSLAWAYLQFLDREKLDLQMLIDAFDAAEATSLNLNKSRRDYMVSGLAIHDMLHVVTGYGRDPVGEACVLAFTTAHLDLPSITFFSQMLALREQASHFGLRVIAARSEARSNAANVRWLPEIDWRDYLAKPLHVVRRELGFIRPDEYLKISPGTWNTLDPKRASREGQIAA